VYPNFFTRRKKSSQSLESL